MGILGSIQVGSGSRFSSAVNPSPVDDTDPNVSTVQISSPPAPLAYQGLRTGPDFTLEYEPEVTPSIDGSDRFLRTLSPFMIQVEPPSVFGSQPASTNSGSHEGPRANPAGIYAAAKIGGGNPFVTARSALQTAGIAGDFSASGKSVEEYITAGQLARRGGDGTQVMTVQKGNGPGRISTPAIADVQVAVDIALQLKAITETPPLVLLINPQSLSMSHTKLQQYSDRTRFGFVFQAWGEEQPKLSISARIGAFISGSRGVQWASRRDSASWQNLMTAFHFYRHNGYVYDTVGKSNAHHFVGALSIHYDQWVYYGNMESFSYSLEDTSTQLGGVVFDMEFTVSVMVDTSKAALTILPMKSPVPSPSDPRFQGQNQRAFNRPGTVSVGLDGVVRGQQSTITFERGTGIPLRVTAATPIPAATSAAASTSGFQVAPPAAAVTAATPESTSGFQTASSAAAVAQTITKSQRPPPAAAFGMDKRSRRF